MLLGRERIRAGEITDHTQCRLGRWYYGRGAKSHGRLAAFRDLEEPHRKIHQAAGLCVEAWNRGDAQEAKRLYREVVDLSQQILELLSQLRVSEGARALSALARLTLDCGAGATGSPAKQIGQRTKTTPTSNAEQRRPRAMLPSNTLEQDA